MKEFTVISCPDGLEGAEINDHLANGWELYGPFIVRESHKDEEGYAKFLVWQAMVREKESEPKHETERPEKRKHCCWLGLFDDGDSISSETEARVYEYARLNAENMKPLKSSKLVEVRKIEWEVEG